MAASQRALAGSLRRVTIARAPCSQPPVLTTASISCTGGSSISRKQRALGISTTATTTRPISGLMTTTATYRPAPRATTSSVRWYSASEGEQSPSRKWEFEEVDSQVKLNAELDKSGGGKDGRVIFVDVREPHELHQTGKIPGAINIPITTAVQSFHIPEEDFEDMYGFPRPAKDAPLVFYCKAGVRARGAAALAQHAGWSNVGDYPGSWIDWEARSGPVEPVKKQD